MRDKTWNESKNAESGSAINATIRTLEKNRELNEKLLRTMIRSSDSQSRSAAAEARLRQAEQEIRAENRRRVARVLSGPVRDALLYKDSIESVVGYLNDEDRRMLIDFCRSVLVADGTTGGSYTLSDR